MLPKSYIRCLLHLPKKYSFQSIHWNLKMTPNVNSCCYLLLCNRSQSFEIFSVLTKIDNLLIRIKKNLLIMRDKLSYLSVFIWQSIDNSSFEEFNCRILLIRFQNVTPSIKKIITIKMFEWGWNYNSTTAYHEI